MNKLVTIFGFLLSLNGFAAGVCTIDVNDGSSIFTTSTQTVEMPSSVKEEFVEMNVEKYPELLFKARNNGDNEVIISVEIKGNVHFFVIGEKRAFLSYYPNQNFKIENIRISCDLKI